MSKFKARLASHTKPAHGHWFIAGELSWIMLAVGGLLLFAYITA